MYFLPYSHNHIISNVDGLQTALDGKVSQSISTSADLNTITTSGFYRVGNTNANMPSGGSYGQLIVSRGADTITQIIGAYGSGKLYTRSGNPSNIGGSGGWTDWKEIIDSSTIGSQSVNYATSAGSATTAINVSAQAGTTNANRHIWFSDSATETKRAYDDDFKYNPSTNILTVGSITGNADTATKPLGFNSRQTSISWGVLANSSYTCITRWDTANSGSVAFADKDGQTSMQIDGSFYQGEGNYKVLDTSTGLQLTGGTMSGQIAFPKNSSLYPLSFSAGNGGAFIDTYGNFKATDASAQTWNLMDSGGTPRFSVKWATGDTTIEGALTTKGRVITNQGDSAKRQFNTIDTLYLVNRTLGWNTNSYYQHVVLLLPVPTSNNFVGTNYFEGKFMFWKTGGNMYDTVYVSLNCVYNQLNYHIHNYGQHNNWKLCVCTYGGISYYALKCPYHDNPYNQVVFHGHLNTSLNSGIIPQDVAYYDENSKSILNSEVYNSLTENLSTKYITSVSAKALISSKGGIISNQMGNLTRATTTATYADSYHLTYTCVTAADAGSLPAIDNANGILTLNTHEGNYYHQLGFVSGDGGALYRRYFYSVEIFE